ncbi:MAG TPA: putative 2OG-Fe(II) oxygenase [Sphingomicrobium sp.]|nr:putative 2OG-Fe(II) oxygenase [Sphingomicrobium sp.]
MSFEAELKAARSGRVDSERLGELARTALAQQREEDVLPLLARTARNDARLWQWKGLLERALDEHAEALKSFAEAGRFAPNDGGIAHGHARVALEAGVASIPLFSRALQLAPDNAQVYLGLTAARIAAGEGEQAEADLDQILARSSLWIEGHKQLAQVRSLLGRREHAYDSLDRALAAQPQQSALWQALFDLEVQAEDYERLSESAEAARSAGVPAQVTRTYAFIAASELGRTSSADELLKVGGAGVPPVWLVRHALRNGRMEEAVRLIDSQLSGPKAADIWPYAETAWRMTGDPRLEWLAGDSSLISIIDLGEELAAIPGLNDLLRSLHAVSGRYLNQSVRGGSQTDGPLLSRIEPEIRALRAIIVRAVEGHVARFGSLPDSHPQKMAGARRIRFSGSWSVRLVDGGFHSVHVHPRGWISSALYLGLPEKLSDEEGWLTLSEPPPELRLDLAPARTVPPKIGQLVLFPSWMWHGTRPFPTGERLSVAFDVAPPVS